MQVKRFVALTMQDAVAMVREQLGPDAVILHTRRRPKRGLFRLLRRPRYEVVAAVETPRPRPTMARGQGKRAQSFHDLHSRQLTNDATGDRTEAPEPPLPDSVEQVVRQLRDQAVEEELIQSFLGELRDRAEQPGDLESLAWVRATFREMMERRFPCIDSSRIGDDARVIVLIGPTGVGKTTTVAKLAANFALIAEKDVAIITADTYRIAAVDQLRTYANLIGAPLSVVYTPEEMQQAIAEHRERDMILVDTAGRSQYDKMQMNELRTFLAVIEEPQIHLVISATTKAEDLVDTLERFHTIGFDRLIITKIDETRTLGPLLKLSHLSGKQIAYLTAGQSVPDDIEVAEAGAIAERILGRVDNAGSS